MHAYIPAETTSIRYLSLGAEVVVGSTLYFMIPENSGAGFDGPQPTAVSVTVGQRA